MWDEIIIQFLSFNVCTFEVCEWISNVIPHFTWCEITYPWMTRPCRIFLGRSIELVNIACILGSVPRKQTISQHWKMMIQRKQTQQGKNHMHIFGILYMYHDWQTWYPYMLSRGYRVVKNRYARLLFTSEDRFCANLWVRECHNVSTTRSCDRSTVVITNRIVLFVQLNLKSGHIKPCHWWVQYLIISVCVMPNYSFQAMRFCLVTWPWRLPEEWPEACGSWTVVDAGTMHGFGTDLIRNPTIWLVDNLDQVN